MRNIHEIRWEKIKDILKAFLPFTEEKVFNQPANNNEKIT